MYTKQPPQVHLGKPVSEDYSTPHPGILETRSLPKAAWGLERYWIAGVSTPPPPVHQALEQEAPTSLALLAKSISFLGAGVRREGDAHRWKNPWLRLEAAMWIPGFCPLPVTLGADRAVELRGELSILGVTGMKAPILVFWNLRELSRGPEAPIPFPGPLSFPL